MTEETYPNPGRENSTNEQIYRITGKVIDVKTRIGIPGLRVEAWDNDLIFDDLLGSAVTGSGGSFLIIFKESAFADVFLEQCPDLFFKIFPDGERIFNTRNSILWNVCNPESNIVIELDLSSGDPGESLLRVYGIVRNEFGEPLIGFLVKAFHVPVISGNEAQYILLGEELSDLIGRYQIDFSEALYKNTAAGRDGPNLLVNVYDQSGVKIGQSRQVDDAGRITELNIDIDGGYYRVYGVVLDGDNKPVPHVTVQAFERDMRNRQLLGTVETDANGGYRIDYQLADFQLGDAPSNRTPWLVVEVRDRPDGTLLAQQQIRRAEPHQYLELRVASAVVSEFQRVNEIVTPFLKGLATSGTGADLEPFELNAADIEFIVQETNLDRAAVEAWVASSKIVEEGVLRLTIEYAAQQTTLRKNGWSFLYGLARQGLAQDLNAVLRESAANWLQTWRRALSANRVPGLTEEQLDLLVAALELLQRLQQIDPAHSDSSGLPQVLVNLLIPLPKAVALDVLAIFQEHGLDADAFLVLVDQYSGSAALINAFIRGVRVYQLADGHEGLFGQLNSSLHDTTASIASLAVMPSTEWIKAPVTPGFALQLQARTEMLYPLTAIKARLEAESLELEDAVITLINEQGALAESILRGEEIPDPAYAILRDIGRFVRTGLNMDMTGHLINNDIKSPAVAIRYGRNAISGLLGNKYPMVIAGELANAFFDYVEPLVNSANGFLTGLVSTVVVPMFMRGEDTSSLPGEVEEIVPSLSGLFGDMDECICKPCESMLGQPAYLVDLLNLLKKCPTDNQDNPTAYNLLTFRRPDIPNLPLSCENTEELKQHIDLVLEILEEEAGNDPYQLTASAYFPWRLPFGRPRAEINAYLAKLNVTRLNLLLLRSNPEPIQLTAETLNLSVLQTGNTSGVSDWLLITQERVGAELWKAYGLIPEEEGQDRITWVDPASGELLENQLITDVLNRVSVLLDRTGLNLEELELMLATNFVGPELLLNREQCKTSAMRLPANNSSELEAILNPLHRFVRLHAKLYTEFSESSIAQLDRAIGLVTKNRTTDLNETALNKLALLKRLSGHHELPFEHLLGLPSSVADLRRSLGLSVQQFFQYLLGLPNSIGDLRQSLGLSVQQFAMLKKMTNIDPASKTFEEMINVDPSKKFDESLLEQFCKAVERIRESGLSIEQTAAALLPTGQLTELGQERLPSLKSKEQIEVLLKSLQQRLGAVSVVRSDVVIVSQAAEALSNIFDTATAARVFEAIKSAGAKNASVRTADAALIEILSGGSGVTHSLGDWSPLLSVADATKILTVSAKEQADIERRSTLLAAIAHIPDLVTAIAKQSGFTPADVILLLNANNTDSRFTPLLEGIAQNQKLVTAIAEQCRFSEPDVIFLLESKADDTDTRFSLLLTGVTERRRERELVATIAEQSGFTEQDVILFLGDRLLLDSPDQKKAFERFLDASFWEGDPPPSVTGDAFPLLHNWMDRLSRLVGLSAALNLDSELMWLADRVVFVDDSSTKKGINWRDMLATTTAVLGVDWQALLDLVWLQRPEQLSRKTLLELFDKMEELKAQPVMAETLRPLATRLGMDEGQTLAIAKKATSVTNADDLRASSKLRKAFELLLPARHLGATAEQLNQLANFDNNTTAASTAKKLLHAKVGEQAWLAELKKIEDPLRQQRRDALVAYLTHGNPFRDVNHLYEHFLIDPQVQPCLETTRILEAITAIQLFAQRILFGLEPGISAGPELKQRWTWMRNYRVWEANRKVFLFPENWLYPELRDDKSSSFKLLESALGQGELTQELAKQSFGQFLDDVAQMGQVEVLGMYEDIARDDNGNIKGDTLDGKKIPKRRTLYIIGRTLNPPYAYFWRDCEDFGSDYMEWSPWQRIELDIQGDHVLPFVLSGQFHVAWPVFKQTEGQDGQDPVWEVRFAWTRFNGTTWKRQETSREPWIGVAAPFRNERNGFSMRCEVDTNASAVTITGYVATQPPNSTIVPSPAPAPSTKKQIGEKPWIDYFDNHSYNYLKAGLRVYCNCWIKLRNASDQIAFIKLEPASAYPNVVLKPFGWTALRLDSYLTLSGSGPIPPVSFSIEGNIRGIPLPVTPAQSSPEIPIGDFTDVTLHFTVDATKLDAKALGFELDIPLKFEPKLHFQIDRFGQGNYLEDLQQNPLPVPDLMNPWMNGYREALYSGFSNWPFSVRDSTSGADRRIFEISSNEYYWTLGSVSNRSHLHTPGIWYFRERGTGVYIDLSIAQPQTSGGFRLYADGYPESAEYRATWGSEGSLDNLDLQYTKFGSLELPLPGSALIPDTWVAARAGDLAYDSRMPYACYNWEVFFHAPLLIADQLSKQHKFEDADRWLRYVFDPTNGGNSSDPKRFFKFRVFKDLDLHKQVIDDLTALAQLAHSSGTTADNDKVKKLIERWRDMPFRPFLIARRRHIAFLWRTLFAYLDNLIAWADSQYRRDTRESINEATMLYVLAEHILGRRPQQHQGNSKRAASSYTALGERGDDFANFWIDAGARVGTHGQRSFLGGTASEGEANPDGMLYFCMPYNDKLSTYWNIIEERLFNVRNCRNIEGITRSLPLTDAPIDPELLIRATAAGLDLGDVISGLYAPPPHYRYNILAARAAELANEAKALGAAMLSAIEKRDAEQLAQLRSSNEISLLRLVQEVRTLQISETKLNIDALRVSRNSAGTRYSQYQRLLGNKGTKAPAEQESAGEESMLGSVDGLSSEHSNWGLIKEEDEQYVGFREASGWSNAAGIAKTASGVAHLGAAPFLSGVVSASAGEALTATGYALSATGEAFSTVSQGWRSHAEKQGMMAGHIRRRDEWAFQSNQTLKELQQIDKQILANQIRIDITKKELSNHIEQIEQAQAVDEVMRSKFSNEQLYQWMISQLSGLYFNAYRMALEMARRAERAAARELGVKPLNVLRNDYWDSQRSGLLAGERLHQDIKRLEIAYLDQNRREYELTKHISLRRLAPEKLVALRIKDSGGNCSCEFDIPEWLFDLDTPGHYLRRIKSVSVSIPCVAGPYTSVNCKLTLLSSHVRHERSLKEGHYVPQTNEDRFTDYFGASEAIVTSNANGDSGLFETQLRDERFLPFEGSGVISTWRLELPGTYPQFDYSTISDVVLSIRYTARDGGDSLRDAATGAITTLLTSTTSEPLRFYVLLSCRSDFPTEWALAKAGTEDLEIPITRDLLPYWIDAVIKPKKLIVLEALHEESTTSGFTRIPATESDSTKPFVTLDSSSGIGEVNLRKSAVGATDKIIILSIGPRT